MDITIYNNIISDIAKIEEKYDVTILHAAESGSRAWGFASPDSDYDVRFFYVHNDPNYYLQLQSKKDYIEYELNDIYDINGWDLCKTLQLLYKSNPTIFEWYNSPITYHDDPRYVPLKNIIPKYFEPKASLYHYLNMAKSNYKAYIDIPEDKPVRLKKYFYIIRPLLCCEHVLINKTPPPILFSDLLIYLPNNILPEVNDLIDIKTKTSELGTGKHITVLDNYIKTKIEEISKKTANISSDRNKNWNPLNKTFLDTLFLIRRSNNDEKYYP